MESILHGLDPVDVREVKWARWLRIASYLGDFPVPEELVVSVRCVVTVGASVVVCREVGGGRDILPGGRREPGESYVDTACREIHEETGWHLDRARLRPIGLLHLRNLGEPLPPYPFPHSFHVVYRGHGVRRSAQNWTDTEGQVVESVLVPAADVAEALTESALGQVFLAAATS